MFGRTSKVKTETVSIYTVSESAKTADAKSLCAAPESAKTVSDAKNLCPTPESTKTVCAVPVSYVSIS
ncbi:unnamed protein product [Arabis nemorensis]|uniref:Uncharacterized protein n=1 Tax=Arabis nemorensis TaxID=586526 RepID=A0A565BDF3_9BRAS|nr:unnamed protein product [Arabis nemorensis]